MPVSNCYPTICSFSFWFCYPEPTSLLPSWVTHFLNIRINLYSFILFLHPMWSPVTSVPSPRELIIASGHHLIRFLLGPNSWPCPMFYLLKGNILPACITPSMLHDLLSPSHSTVMPDHLSLMWGVNRMEFSTAQNWKQLNIKGSSWRSKHLVTIS